MSREKIVLASDHGGYDLKVILKNFLVELGYDVLDLGCDGPQSVDYPDYAHALADAIKEQKAARGVLVCGSGIGISIAVNRHPHIRAALVHDRLTAELSRQHNNFEGGRHQRRIDKMS